MKLIGSYTSPFVRKISVILLEKGIVFEFVNDAPYSPDSHVALHNPLGKVPTLIDDSQQAWFDSSIIAQYLELRGDAPALLPEDAWLARTTGMSVESVSKWERGESKPNQAVLRIINMISDKGPEIFMC